MAVGKDPVLLLWMKQQAEDVEVETIFLIGGAFVRADEQTAFHLRVCQQHDLQHKKKDQTFLVASLAPLRTPKICYYLFTLMASL